MKRYYISKVVGTGVFGDTYRAKVADYGVPYAAVIPTDDQGKPKFGYCFVLAGGRSHALLRADPDIKPLPDFPLDGKLSGIQTQVMDAAEASLRDTGFIVSNLSNSAGYRDWLKSIVAQQDPLVNIDNMDVQEQ
jgi:hypothetical protein